MSLCAYKTFHRAWLGTHCKRTVFLSVLCSYDKIPEIENKEGETLWLTVSEIPASGHQALLLWVYGSMVCCVGKEGRFTL